MHPLNKPILFLIPEFSRTEFRGSIKDICYLKKVAIDNTNKTILTKEFKCNLFYFVRFFLDLYSKYNEYSIVAGPLARLSWFAIFLPRNRSHIVVGDSPYLNRLLTPQRRSIRYFISLLKWSFIERLLSDYPKIVASSNDYMWYRSRCKDESNVRILNPYPSVCPQGISRLLEASQVKSIDLLFLNPNSGGIQLTKKLLKEFDMTNINLKAKLITSSDSLLTFSQSFRWLSSAKFVDDLDELIVKSEAVIITDIGGGGFCNRSLHVMLLKTPLLCTLDSLRGINFNLRNHATVCTDAKSFVYAFEKQSSINSTTNKSNGSIYDSLDVINSIHNQYLNFLEDI